MSVFIIASLSADGFIAPKEFNPKAPSTTWTSPEDTAFFQEKTKAAGVIIIGRKTYETIPKKYRPLKDRLNIIITSKHPSIKNAFDFSPTKDQPLTTSLAPQSLTTALKQAGYSRLAICGGTSIYTQFLEAGVIDELFLTIEPIIFGSGIPLFDKPLKTKLHLKKIIDLSKHSKVLHYQVKNSKKSLP